MRSFYFSLLVVLVVAIFFYTERESIHVQLDKWKLIPRPERFTELYLENHADLPRSVVAGQIVPFSFTVHNLEGKTMEYPYEVYALAQNESEQQTIGRGNIILDHDAAKTIESSFVFPENQKKTTIFIVLPTLDQEIHFILSSN